MEASLRRELDSNMASDHAKLANDQGLVDVTRVYRTIRWFIDMLTETCCCIGKSDAVNVGTSRFLQCIESWMKGSEIAVVSSSRFVGSFALHVQYLFGHLETRNSKHTAKLHAEDWNELCCRSRVQNSSRVRRPSSAQHLGQTISVFRGGHLQQENQTGQDGIHSTWLSHHRRAVHTVLAQMIGLKYVLGFAARIDYLVYRVGILKSC